MPLHPAQPLNYIEPSLHPLARPIDTIKPDPANARRHSERNIEAIRRSLAGFRQQTPIVVDNNGVCWKGNATLTAALALG